MNLSGGMSLGARRGLIIDDDWMVNPLTELPLYAGFWADDPAWVGPGVGNAVSSWLTAGTLRQSGAYLDATNGLTLPGVAGNYASVPDEAALDITGDITLVARVALTDWTPSATQTVIGKWTATGNQRSYSLNVLSTGVVRINVSTDGSTTTVAGDSTVAAPFADGSVGWIAAALDGDDGAGNRVIKFWTSSDGVTWSQLGTTVTTAGTVALFASTAIAEFGSVSSGTAQNVAGSVSVARVYSGSGFTTSGPTGTLVLDVDFRRNNTDQFVCSTGQTVTVASTFNAVQATAGSRPTLTTSALLGGRRVVDFDGTDDRLEILTGVSLEQPFEVWAIFVTDSVTGNRLPLGFNSASVARGVGHISIPPERWFAGAGTTLVGGTPVVATGYLARYVLNGASSAVYVNGASVASGNANTGAVDQVILGAGRTAPSTYSNYFDGKTAFLGILPAASITATHRRQFALWAAQFYSVPGFAAAA